MTDQIPADLASYPAEVQAKIVDYVGLEIARRERRDHSDYVVAMLGMAISFVTVAALIVVGTVLTSKDHDTVGGVIFGTTIIAFAGAFVVGRTTK